MIGKYLDLGTVGIEVSQVSTPEVAAEAVEKFYYPPLGIRSIGGNFRSRLGHEDQDLNDNHAYPDLWNQCGILWLQVETLQAVLGGSNTGPAGSRLPLLRTR